MALKGLSQREERTSCKHTKHSDAGFFFFKAFFWFLFFSGFVSFCLRRFGQYSSLVVGRMSFFPPKQEKQTGMIGENINKRRAMPIAEPIHLQGQGGLLSYITQHIERKRCIYS
jgi:hypothetical protein